jgi:hypothetical protein
VRKPALAEWQGDTAYRYGARLYVEGFFWEAHEVWEAVWKAAPPNGVERLMLRGLIQLANAALKLKMDRAKAALRLLLEARELLGEAAVAARSEEVMGVPVPVLGAGVEALAATVRTGAEAPEVSPILAPLARVVAGWTPAETAL